MPDTPREQTLAPLDSDGHFYGDHRLHALKVDPYEVVTITHEELEAERRGAANRERQNIVALARQRELHHDNAATLNIGSPHHDQAMLYSLLWGKIAGILERGEHYV